VRPLDNKEGSIWAVRGRRCPALAAARNRRFCGGIPPCPAAARLECGRIARSSEGGGITGDLGPCRPGPAPAELPRGSATVKIALGKGTPQGNRRGTGTGPRPKGTNRRTPNEGKPEDGGGRGRTRRANGKPEESPPGGTGGRAVRPQTTRCESGDLGPHASTMPLAQSWQVCANCRLSVASQTLHSPRAPACALCGHRCSRIRSFGAGVGSLAVQDAGRPDRGVLHARGADGVHGDRPVIHVGGGCCASRSRAGFDERTRLRFSRISIARCAGLVPVAPRLP
jgi:hypothetical protein